MNLRAILQKKAKEAGQAADRISNLRGAVFFIGGGAIVALLLRDSKWTLHLAATAFAIFIWLIVLHQRIALRRNRYLVRLRLLDRDEARKRLDWAALPELSLSTPAGAKLPSHFWDLDIAGSASLLRLLNQTLSEQGLDSLVRLFDSSQVADGEINERQQIVRDLQRKTVFRRRLAVTSEMHSEHRLRTQEMMGLAGREVHGPTALAWTWALAGVQLLSHVGAAFCIILGWPPYFLAGWIAIFALYRAGESRFHEPFDRALSLESQLTRFVEISSVIEKHKVAPGTALARLLAPFHASTEGAAPTQLLRELARWVSFLSVRGSPAVHFLLNLALPWDFWVTLRLERTRRFLADRLPIWTRAMGQLEAFCSLAGFAELFPMTIYPTLLPAADGEDVVEARALAHPLIAADRRISNDLTLNSKRSCLLITGSNMSGKSTFLRTLGVNVLLAKAGAPVLASRFRYRALDVRTSLRIGDSLQDEVSTFYAEVRQLSEVLVAAKSPHGAPVLYLIDEIFRGTNNRERLIGSRAYIEALLRTRSSGLIATHDLELADLERDHPGLHNMHFRETIEDGRMLFSYELREGPCPSTNALRIMALAGLPVP